MAISGQDPGCLILVITPAAARLAGARRSLAWDKHSAVAGVDRLAISCLADGARILLNLPRAAEQAVLAKRLS